MEKSYNSYEIKEMIHIEKMHTMFEMKYDKNYSFPGESHDFWECLYVISGNVCVSADERVYSLSEGEIIFHKPLEMHKFHIENEQGAHLFIFSFEMDGILEELFRDRVFRLSSEQKQTIGSLLKFLRKKTEYYRQSQAFDVPFHEEYLYGFKKLETYSHIVSTYICRLFLSLCDNNGIEQTSESPDALIFKNAINIMNANLHTWISVETLARECHISQSGLKRIFGKYSGFPVHKYFLKLKTNLAAQHLAGGVSVTEIAKLLGFSSQGYFSSVFKRETGFTPYEYKNREKTDKPKSHIS